MSLDTTEEGVLLNQILQAKGGAQPLIEGINHFVNHRIPKIIEAKTITTVTGKVITLSLPKFSRPTITDKNNGNKPVTLWPAEARIRTLNYMAKLFVTVTFNERNPNTGALVPIPGQQIDMMLGKFPVMIGTELDNLSTITKEERVLKGEPEKDPCGYFIMHAERLLLNIERLRTRSPFLYEDKGKYNVRYTSKSLFDSTIVKILEDHDDMMVFFSGMKQTSKVNIFTIFYILGLEPYGEESTPDRAFKIMDTFIADSDPVRLARRKKELRQYLQITTAAFMKTTEGSRREKICSIMSGFFERTALVKSPNQFKEIQDIVGIGMFKNITYPPFPVNKTQQQFEQDLNGVFYAKIRMLAYMIVKYVDFKNGYRKPDDRDDWGNKMIEDASVHMETKFIEIYNVIMNAAEKKIINSKVETVANIKAMFDNSTMEAMYNKAFVSGMWFGAKTTNSTVVVDMFSRETLLSSHAHIKRISAPSNRQASIRPKRMVKNTQWAIIDPAATPEGVAVGLVKEAAITTYISLERDESIVHNLLNGYYSVIHSPEKMHSLFLNGVHLGYCNTREVRAKAMNWRRTQQIHFDTGIIMDVQSDLWIYTTSGRMCRPILIVETDEKGFSQRVIDKKNLKGASLQELMKNGALEYIDAAEQSHPDIFIATLKEKIDIQNENRRISETPLKDPHYTHAEIDPGVILGISTSVIPMSNMMPGPRTTYQASMGKQAMGPNSIRNELRYETTFKQLGTPGVPFAATESHERVGLDRFPAGANVVVAIMAMEGLNEEDSIVMNRASLERGLFRHTVYHSYKTVANMNEEIRIPDKNSARYAKLDENGIIRVGSIVVPGDALVGKVLRDTSDKKNVVTKDTTLYAEIGKEGIVDHIIKTDNPPPEGGILVRIRLRQVRLPVPGDKFASRYAQKGVIGKIVDEEDMPFISSGKFLGGIRPDIVFNPHGIPTRMTVSKLVEFLFGRITAATGKRINTTAFRKFDINTFMDYLSELGMNRTGKETFIDGKTGKPLEVQLFTGPVYYQILRHLVRDKAQARSTGAVQYLTRQPVAGIRKQGGLRYGHMEIAALVEHGSMSLLQERTSKSSDAYKFVVCKACGTFAHVNSETGEKVCRVCNRCDDSSLAMIEMPYSMKLLTQILAGSFIKLQFKF